MKGKDEIKELFSEKLGNHEVNVNPELWGNIASQVGAASTVVSGGMSLATKIVIGVIGAASVVTVTTLVLFNDSESEQPKETPIPVVEENTTLDPEKDQKTITAESLPVNSENRTIEENEITHNQVEEEHDNAVFPVEGEERVTIEDDPSVDLKPRESTPSSEEKDVVSTNGNPTENTSSEVKEDKEETPEEPEIQYEEEEMVLPNFFSPNNDGSNDKFFFEVKGITNFKIVILDQNNEIVFESDNPDFEWDGTNQMTGEKVKEGIHAYFVTGKDTNGKPFKKYQQLMIMFR